MRTIHSEKSIPAWQLVLCVCLLLVPLAFAQAAFSNAQAALDALGQYGTSLTNPGVSFTKSAFNNGPNVLGLWYPSHTVVDTVRHRLFATDSNNKRILVYALSSSNTLNSYLPTYVIGQSDFQSKAGGSSQNPYGLAYDSANDRLFVSFYYANRVLVYDTSTIVNGMGASFVLGQPDLISMTGATTQSGMKNPLGLAYDTATARLFVADTTNNRVLVFSGASIATGMNAIAVLGQSNFTAATATATQAGMNAPEEVAYDPSTQHIFVTEYNNNRVLVYSGSALGNGMSAATVLGQGNFTTTAAATTQAGLRGPIGITYDNAQARLFVADYGNRRVVTFSGALLSNGMAANTVLGQATFTGSTAGTTQSRLTEAYGLSYTPGANQLFVGDSANNRFLVFDGSALRNGANAVNALGQYDSVVSPSPAYTKSGRNDGPNALGFQQPYALALDSTHHRLFVVEYGNSRVLVFMLNNANVIASRSPSYVLGQANFYSNTPATTQSGLRNPAGAVYDANHDRLFVSDYGNNRILAFDASALANGMNASHVLGQTLFTTATGAVTRAGMRSPYGLAYDTGSDRLFASFYSDNRVLVYSGSSISTGMNANTVLGQSSFTTTTAATTPAGMSGPIGLAYDTSMNRLFVGQYDSNRISVFSGSSISTGMSANTVLGQSSFTTGAAATTQGGLRTPYSLRVDPGSQRLFVADYGNNRVLIYSVASLSMGMSASGVLGQTDFTLATAATDQAGMSGPIDVAYDSAGDRLFVADYGNNRILLFGDPVSVATVSSSSSSSESPPTPSGGGRRGSPGRGGVAAPMDALRQASSAGKEESAAKEPAVSSSSPLPIPQTTIVFSDVLSDAWFTPFVTELVNAGIASGYLDVKGNPTGLFGPADPVSYAQVAKMALLAAGKTIDPAAVPANPSARDTWAMPFIAAAESLSLSIFRADLPVHAPAPRGAVVATLLETLGIPLQDGIPSPFSDLPADHPQARAILTAWKLGLITGDTDRTGQPTGTVRPNDPINRAEAAKIITLARGVGRKEESMGFQTLPEDQSRNGTTSPDHGRRRLRVVSPANLRVDARTTATVREVLSPGTEVTVLRVIDDIWVEVEIPSGKRGFVAALLLE